MVYKEPLGLVVVLILFGFWVKLRQIVKDKNKLLKSLYF
ncbi:hypothetical protein NU09_1504 [Flavobacterium beibuense]|uniref:Uncharacterized protein n=1 Tax=Flavobacterium beibuense TaxID=657326 RepID=A0A444WBI5_9FLAO|nr:hypothetical protein NU09_1504 [Flavobacterium beibuense]